MSNDYVDTSFTITGYIDKWHLVRHAKGSTNSKNKCYKCCPLPETNIFTPQHTLYGYLLPRWSSSTKSKPLDNLPVAITGLISWCIDRSDDDRGIWIQTSAAWYRLREPNDEETLPFLDESTTTTRAVSLACPPRQDVPCLPSGLDQQAWQKECP